MSGYGSLIDIKPSEEDVKDFGRPFFEEKKKKNRSRLFSSSIAQKVAKTIILTFFLTWVIQFRNCIAILLLRVLSMRELYNYTSMKLIHLANPKSRPVGIIVFAHVVRPSVRPSPLFKSRKTKQQKTMLATVVTMGFAEWIIDDTCLVLCILK